MVMKTHTSFYYKWTDININMFITRNVAYSVYLLRKYDKTLNLSIDD